MLRTAGRRGKRRRSPRGSAHRKPGGGSGRVLLAASAVALGLATLALLLTWGTAGTGSASRLAVGAAGASADPAHPVPPDGKVTLVPLNGTPVPPPGTAPTGRTTPSANDGTAHPAVGAPTGGAPTGNTSGGNTPSGARSGSGQAPEPSVPPAPGTPSAPGSPSAPGHRPAHLQISGVRQAATGQRWCQDVTVDFTNSGDLPVTSGTVTFATHVIGLLGVDWATVDTTEKVPVPIAGGQRVSGTWQICLDSWRVPLGMHIETRSVTLQA
ncbi:hypothetical protein ACFOSC_13585 [Streptantibioticus rubrisoli]|uniref:Secreted protein n=1 Tax=Streptantibioticus rubrisoli TaxID=1387313 RepID=A0ABT1PCF9_9ACTN|nr:hypothetical protein [Streptantibioticus rubrisoli]MCQ4043042.1 hypothetical protein [Streptantibioticus rubrisoli]